MNTDLRERAEASLKKHHCYPFLTGIDKSVLDAMLDFHKQELQIIGEVVYVPVSEDEAEEAEWNEIKAQRLGWFSGPYGWLKKLPLLEVKDFEASDNNVK